MSGGRCTATEALAGLPVVFITTTGARTGLKRRIPLGALPDGERWLLVASRFGSQHHPGWYHNLIADPHVILERHGQRGRCLARELHGEAWRQAWDLAVEWYPGYAAYARRAGTRHIPILELLPEEA